MIPVQFEYETFYDEDNTWEALFVFFRNQWRMAYPLFGTENKEDIVKQIQLLK